MNFLRPRSSCLALAAMLAFMLVAQSGRAMSTAKDKDDDEESGEDYMEDESSASEGLAARMDTEETGKTSDSGKKMADDGGEVKHEFSL